jgi:hypothetical protein
VLGAEALRIGTAGAYRDRSLEASGHELVSAILVALTDRSAQARWWAGEEIFI